MLQQNYYLQAALIVALHLRPELCWLSQLSKSKLHRTRVGYTAPHFLQQVVSCCVLLRAQRDRNELGKAGSSTLGQFLPIYLLGGEAGMWDMALVTCGTVLGVFFCRQGQDEDTGDVDFEFALGCLLFLTYLQSHEL